MLDEHGYCFDLPGIDHLPDAGQDIARRCDIGRFRYLLCGLRR